MIFCLTNLKYSHFAPYNFSSSFYNYSVLLTTVTSLIFSWLSSVKYTKSRKEHVFTTPRNPFFICEICEHPRATLLSQIPQISQRLRRWIPNYSQQFSTFISTTSLPVENWNAFLKNKTHRKELFVSTILLIIVLTIFFFVLQYAEQRNGFVIEKGWMNSITAAKDFSPFIFACTYSAVIAGIIFCFRKPSTTLLLIRTFLLLQFLRAITLLTIPLDPPENAIPLIDPFLHNTFYHGRANLKDLFFSGHVATIIIFIPIISNKWLKYFLVAAAFLAALFLAWQRVHYIADIIAAPLFSILAYSIAKKWTTNTIGLH